MHRIVHLFSLGGALLLPLLSALASRFFSRIAVKHIIPLAGTDPLPMHTQTWIVGVANGNVPLVAIAIIVSLLIGICGIYVLVSKRISADLAATTLPMLCLIAGAIAVILFVNTLTGLVLPFLSKAE